MESLSSSRIASAKSFLRTSIISAWLSAPVSPPMWVSLALCCSTSSDVPAERGTGILPAMDTNANPGVGGTAGNGLETAGSSNLPSPSRLVGPLPPTNMFSKMFC